MSSNTKMLIDATHPEETRVVVQRNGRVEEFDFESAARKLLRGNIYLAKVTRVEPSLQAAFVDYGGNRHGFLAFNEIHPDYYQIPMADRQALIDEEAAAEAELEAAADRRADALAKRAQRRQDPRSAGPQDRSDGDTTEDASHDAHGDDEHGDDVGTADAGEDAPHIIDVEEDEHIEEVGGDGSDADGDSNGHQTFAARLTTPGDVISEDYSGRAAEADETSTNPTESDSAAEPHASHHEAEDDEDAADAGEADTVEAAGSAANDDAADDAHDSEAPRSSSRGRSNREFGDEAPARQRRRPRSYKIQEVIKRRQIILVQVVKEERGNKGAALTTYLSLAGRYTVLMPNTARGGGISRKITNPQDRKRLKAIANELEVPEGMGLIIRTAGAARTKQEIKRDFEYLLRLWESVRDLTLQSTAPSLVYEEGDLIKRSIRDLYNKDVEEVVVAGDAGYDEAAAFMRMLMPSHAKNVVPYKNPTPLFTSFGVERQLNAMFLPQVTLRSGGYIVINQTEALVAIDVNSGKSTREFSIEETALATNLEAADEIARQLKLRDLAGLIVIDFIDMEEKRNNRAVERRLKDALRFDRARIQLGRISHFGLMEMSRQRLRTGVLEGSTSQCPHCQGTGIIRSTESIALAVLRGLEDAITAGANAPLIATTTPAVAMYILNTKRAYITDMEQRHGYAVTITGSDRIQGANFTVERGAASALPLRRPERAAVNMDWGFEGENDDDNSFQATDSEVGEASNIEEIDTGESQGRGEGDEDSRRGRRRRRRGRGRGGRSEQQRGDDAGGRAARGGDRPDEAFDAADSANQGGTPDEGEGDADGEDTFGDDHGNGGQRAERDDGAPGEEGRSERTGRRRRRGRRGGRRGRDGNGVPREDSLSEQAAPGLGDQPEVPFGDDAGVSVTSKSLGDLANGHSNNGSEGRAPRPERIWDIPSETRGSEATTSAAPSAAADDSRSVSKIDITSRDEVESAPAPAAEVSEPVSAPAVDNAPVVRRHERDSSEARIERVVVGPDRDNATTEDGQPQPQRKGWWQRRFGGE